MADRPQTTLELRTLILVRELFDGTALSFPVAGPKLVSFAEDEADALTEQHVFLEAFLPQQPPETLARFACPQGTELRELDVPLARWDLPARLQLTTPVTICYVVFPHGRDRWILLPALDHTFHCGPREDIEQAVADEARRIVTAREMTPLEFLELLPARAHRLDELTLNLDRSDLIVPGRARERQRAIAERKQRLDALQVLESVALPLHESEALLRGPPLVGRDRELDLLGGLLGGEQRLSALLVGPDLVGKTALFHGWLRRERAAGRSVRAFATSGAQLIAGMSGLGQWQERVRRVMEAASHLDAILYFDNLGDLFADHEGSYVDIAGAMRPYLDEERVRIAGELRPELLDLLEGRHPAFLGALQRVRLESMTADQSRAVLEARLAHAARHEPHRPNLAAEALQPLIDLVERYQPYLPHPGKAVRLFEELRAIGEHATDGSTPAALGEAQLLQLFSVQTGIPLFLLRQDRALKIADLTAAFSKQLAGQQEAIRCVAETICVVKARLQPPGKPLATFLFIGPTGVGKTELARRLAAYLFGSEQRLVRFDMSEFMDAGAAQRLIRGADRAEGLLTRRVRQQPFCVLLLDEVEKAHPAVFDLLLQVCGEGRLTDAAGRTAHFHNAIIVMTSNLGAAGRRATIGLSAASDDDEAYYREQVERAFRPELVNRIDRVVAFHALDRAQIEQVTRLTLQRLDARRGVAELGLQMSVSDRAVARLAADGYSAQYGARQLRRHVEDSLVAPLAELLASLGPQLRGARIDVRTGDEAGESAPVVAERGVGALVLRVLREGGPRRQRAARQTPDISELRRTAALYLQLPAVSEVKDRIDFIVAQLSTRKSKEARDKRLAREAAELQGEHQRLDELWRRAASRCADLETVEELCLAALYEEEDASGFVRESRDCFARFLEALYFLFVAMRPRRDEITLMLQELDDGRAMDLYLAPLLRDLERRRWTAQLHADERRRLPGDGEWPRERRWSPPRTPEWMLEQLELERRPFRTVLLRCSGAYATALALEAGLHQLFGPAGETLLHVSFVAAKAHLSDVEWLDQQLRPRTPGVFPVLRRQEAVRRYETPAGPCLVLGGARQADVPLADYWQRYEQIGVQHLLACEVDRKGSIDDAFASLLYPHEEGA